MFRYVLALCVVSCATTTALGAAAAEPAVALADPTTVEQLAAAKARIMALTEGERELFFAGCVALGYADRAARVYDEAEWDPDRVFHTTGESLLELVIRLDPTEKAEAVQALLAKGVSPQPIVLDDRYAITPADVAAVADQRPPLILAIEKGKEAAARALIAIGGPQLSFNALRYGTPLMLASAYDQNGIVRKLLETPERDSFLNLQAVVPPDMGGWRPPFLDGDTALHIAIRHDHQMIAKRLILAGINLKLRNNQLCDGRKLGFTAHELAVHHERYDLVGFLNAHNRHLVKERKAVEKAAAADQKARAKAAKLAPRATPLLADASLDTELTPVVAGGGSGAAGLERSGTGRHRWRPSIRLALLGTPSLR